MNTWIDCPHCGGQIDATGGITFNQMVTVHLPREDARKPAPPEQPEPVPWGHIDLIKGGDTGWFREGAWGGRLLRVLRKYCNSPGKDGNEVTE